MQFARLKININPMLKEYTSFLVKTYATIDICSKLQA